MADKMAGRVVCSAEDRVVVRVAAAPFLPGEAEAIGDPDGGGAEKPTVGEGDNEVDSSIITRGAGTGDMTSSSTKRVGSMPKTE